MPATHPSTQIADALSPQGKSALLAALAEHGFARVAGIPDARGLVELARSVGTVVSHRDSDSRGVTTIAARLGGVPRGRRAFTRQALAPHTDSSGTATPPHLVFVSCVRAAITGGECVTVDARAIYDDLDHEYPKALADLCAPRTVLFGGAGGHLGAVFTQLAGDRLAVRLRLTILPTSRHWSPAIFLPCAP